MTEITIYHNGECSKCKGALELLQEKGVAHDVRWYMAEPLTRNELSDLLHKLQMPPSSLVRKNEALYKTQYEGKEISDDEWTDILIEHPQLMQRPIVVKGEIAIVARPAEKVLALL